MKRWLLALCRRRKRLPVGADERPGSTVGLLPAQEAGPSAADPLSSGARTNSAEMTNMHNDSEISIMENIITNNEFSEGLHSWHPNACHAFVASEESGYLHGIRPNSGASYVVLANRTESWQGLDQDITQKIILGMEYTVSAYVRVHGNLQGPTGVQATLKMENQDSSTSYLSIGSVLASNESWEKLEGSFQLTTLPRCIVFYLEGPPPGIDLLIDSVNVSYKRIKKVTHSQSSEIDNIISNHDFSEGLCCWTPLCCHAYVASAWSGFLNGIRGNKGENYAVATKRTDTWQGLEQDITEKVSVGVKYTMSAYVRVFGDIQGPTGVQATLRLHQPDSSTSYLFVGWVSVATDHWQKLEGSFSLESKPKAVVFYLEGPPSGIDLLIDSVTISHSAFSPSIEQSTMYQADHDEAIIQNPRFEDGLNNWSGRGCKIIKHESTGHGNIFPLKGTYFASATERSQNWNGIEQEITHRVQRKIAYDVTAVVRIFGNPGSFEVRTTLWIQTRNGREQYIGIAKAQASDKEWVHLRGKFLVHGDISKAIIFVEGPPPGIDILVNSLEVKRARKVSTTHPPNTENVLFGVNIIPNSTLGDGLTGWSPLGSCRLSICTESHHMLPSLASSFFRHHQLLSGRYILATNRTETWMGPSQTITDKLKLHLTYRVSSWVRVGSRASGRQHVNVALSVDNQWVNGGQVEADADQWYEIRGSFRIEKQASKVTVYVQGPVPGVDLAVMGLQITPIDRKERFKYLEEKTDKVRKHDVILKFQGPNAGNIIGASMSIRQTHNSFPFGTCISKSNMENEELADFFLKNFNWAVFENEFKWYWTEPEKGKLNYKDADDLLDFCQRHGKEVRGHCIFWEVEDAVQGWLRSLNRNDLMGAVDNRLRDLLSRYRGRFRHHDVNNEMLHGSFYQDRLGKDIRAYMFREAHQLDPSAVLFVNDYNIEDGCDPNSTPEKYIEQILDLQERGAPVRGIGIQGHITHPNGEIICEAFDKLAILGLPIWITELDVSAWNEHVRADDLEVYLREAYAHPAVEGIVLWGFWELFMFREHAHLVDADGEINEAGKRYLALKREWMSNVDGQIDGGGQFRFRGYHGTYTVEVSTPWKKISRSFSVDRGNSPLVLAIDL